jgi:hypothetical protein
MKITEGLAIAVLSAIIGSAAPLGGANRALCIGHMASSPYRRSFETTSEDRVRI